MSIKCLYSRVCTNMVRYGMVETCHLSLPFGLNSLYSSTMRVGLQHLFLCGVNSFPRRPPRRKKQTQCGHRLEWRQRTLFSLTETRSACLQQQTDHLKGSPMKENAQRDVFCPQLHQLNRQIEEDLTG